ncbi:MAG: hypothetical protein WDM77_03645 [Steroidobacteraceae bacterium]
MANLVDSYTATRLGFVGRVREALSLYKEHALDTPLKVAEHLKEMDETRASIEAALGQPLVGKTILEIGPGQQLRQARYFSAENHVVAIDLDEIATSFNPLALLRTLRVNGPVRFAKDVRAKAGGYRSPISAGNNSPAAFNKGKQTRGAPQRRNRYGAAVLVLRLCDVRFPSSNIFQTPRLYFARFGDCCDQVGYPIISSISTSAIRVPTTPVPLRRIDQGFRTGVICGRIFNTYRHPIAM